MPKWCDISTISKLHYLNEHIFKKILQLAISSLLVESFIFSIESLDPHFFSCFSKLRVWVVNLFQNCYLLISHIMSRYIEVLACRFCQAQPKLQLNQAGLRLALLSVQTAGRPASRPAWKSIFWANQLKFCMQPLLTILTTTNTSLRLLASHQLVSQNCCG